MTTLYYNSANGTVRVWSIEAFDDTLIIEHGVLGGEMQESIEVVEENNSGRSLEEQVELRMKSRINKKLDHGYVTALVEANARPTNALGLVKPMLAQPIKKVKDIKEDRIAMQMKYNGHRCLVTNRNGENIAYSRNGKRIDTVPEIVNSISLNEGQTIDGELYVHGLSLQRISSLVKRRQPETDRLVYVVYDMVMNTSFINRYERLRRLPVGPRVIVAATMLDYDLDNLTNSFKHAKENGYEGLILRQDGMGYESSKRSKALIKVKQAEDDEFEVIDIVSSADGWAVLVCTTANGNTFRVSAPGTLNEKRNVYINREYFIGRMVNVEFYETTDGSIPFHPVATMWRNKLGE